MNVSAPFVATGQQCQHVHEMSDAPVPTAAFLPFLLSPPICRCLLPFEVHEHDGEAVNPVPQSSIWRAAGLKFDGEVADPTQFGSLEFYLGGEVVVAAAGSSSLAIGSGSGVADFARVASTIGKRIAERDAARPTANFLLSKKLLV
ncbi:hypothetical protein E2562_024989 [Oryza meyeriana var. granulata]|uniref:Uncharacterized protein n=1 Tax=Oryza meyeriana var. granulata TaxID=110450 RepID=A0A6G1FBR6_9ORYZ|nr:hypothetical protein E2562_024989 [Oryza meyeriana var. granulata]